MFLSALAVRRPITTVMVFLAILLLGMVAYTRLPIQLFPDITMPTVGIFANNDKSATDNLENVTKEIEGLVSEIPGVTNIRSRTRNGSVWVRVQFRHGTDIQYALVEIQEKLATLRQRLDDRRTYMDAFAFSTADWQRNYMYLSVRGPEEADEIFRDVSEKVEDRLKSINGVANVNTWGLKREVAEVEIDADLLSAYGLDLGSVIGRVQSAASDDQFVGRLKVPGEVHYVRLNDRVRTVEELADLYVDGKGVVRLGDISSIFAGDAMDERMSRVNGKNAVRVSLEREADKNLIELARETRKRVAEINATLPPGLELVIDVDLAEFVEKAIAKVKNLALMGAALALFVPLLFFRSIRVAMIVFLSVPISLISVFNLFYAAGLSINVLSIIGLALGVGMLVDNSIVVVENSFRLYGLGYSARDAAREGGVEVGRGLLASTLTTVVVFVPMAFVDSEFRLIAKEPILALVFPLLMSLFVALTIVPVLTALVLRTRTRRHAWGEGGYSAADRLYKHLLKGSIRHRGRLVLVIVALVALTWLESCQRIRQATTSEEPNNEWINFYFQATAGASLAEVNRVAHAIESRMVNHPDAKNFYVSFNRDGGEVDVQLKPIEERDKGRSTAAIRAEILEFVGPVPGAELSLQNFSTPIADPPIDLGTEARLQLLGLDSEIIRIYASRLADALGAVPAVTSSELDESNGDPEYQAVVDRERTRLFNVQAQTIGRYVGATRSSGTISSLQLVDGERRTDVTFIIKGADGGTLDQVKDLQVATDRGGRVPLGELVQLVPAVAERWIRRDNRQSSAEFVYRYRPGTDAQKLSETVLRVAATVPNPGGVAFKVTGEQERLDKRQADFFFTLIAGAILVWVVMAAVFESLWVPFTILATNPLMLIGIVWALDISGLPLDDMAALGVILLVGLAVNNGIVMMDRALTLQRGGYSRTRAVFEASMTRMRPIFMTYLTTVLGLLPMALVGEENDQWRPVAVVVIGGLTTATLLTLVVLPCFYLIGDDFVAWSRRPFMEFLALCFEVPEAIVRALSHPWLVIRRRITLAPRIRSVIRGSFGVVWSVIRLPFSLLLGLPRDLWIYTRTLLRGLKESPASAQSAAPEAGSIVYTEVPEDDALVILRNIQVIFPPPVHQRIMGSTARIFRPSAPGGGVHALHGVNLRMSRGLFGLVGPNGAGKTTLMRVMTGLLEPTRGTVQIFGIPQAQDPAMLAPFIGYLPQTHGVLEHLTLREYLEYFALMTARSLARARTSGLYSEEVQRRMEKLRDLGDPAVRAEAIRSVIQDVNLADVADRPISTYSGGMKQRAGIARVLLQSPPILLVDEPTAGLDPAERIRVRVLLARLAETRLVIVSTHIVEDLEHRCDMLAVLRRGEIVYTGPPAALVARHAADNGRLDAAVVAMLQQPARP